MNSVSRSRRSGWAAIVALLVLPSCSEAGKTVVTEQQTTVTSSETTTHATNAPIELNRLQNPSASRPGPTATIYRGTGVLYNQHAAGGKDADGGPAGDIALNFVSTDVKEVAKGVLGDLLGLNYLVDPSVQGTITIQTSQPLAHKDVLPAFEAALHVSGLALVRQGSLYTIVPYGAASRLGNTGAAGPGYGTEIVQLRYISPEQLRRVIEPIVPQGTIVQVDQARNMIVIGGTDGERAAIRDNIATFDVDWLRGMSFALFTPRNATAKQLASDLGHVMGDEGGPMAGQVKLVPIERMNAVLAISPRASYLDELKIWVDRLDQGNTTTERRIFVYYVQNGRAADLAAVLGKALGIRSSTVGSQSGGGGNANRQSGGGSQFGGGLSSGFGGGSSLGSGLSSGGSGFSSGYSPLQPAQTAPGSQSSGNDAQQPAGNDQPGGLSITADEVNNALLIVATPGEYQTIEAALQRLDILPLQVLIEAAIAEVTLTNDLRYGVQWLFKNGTNTLDLSGAANGAVSSSFPGFSYLYTSGTRITAVLNALEDVTHVDVLSSPKLMVLNNQTAVLQVGDQVPVATQSAVSTTTPGAPVVNSIEYRDTGVILTVTPRVNEGGLVLMDISQEVSTVGATTSSKLDSPTISQRKIGSSVAIQDGQTIALGGLIRDDRTIGKSGVPLLQRIPVLGHLFSQDTNNDTRTELLVLITPRVIRDGRGAAAVTAELRSKLTNLRPE